MRLYDLKTALYALESTTSIELPPVIPIEVTEALEHLAIGLHDVNLDLIVDAYPDVIQHCLRLYRKKVAENIAFEKTGIDVDEDRLILDGLCALKKESTVFKKRNRENPEYYEEQVAYDIYHIMLPPKRILGNKDALAIFYAEHEMNLKKEGYDEFFAFYVTTAKQFETDLNFLELVIKDRSNRKVSKLTHIYDMLLKNSLCQRLKSVN